MVAIPGAVTSGQSRTRESRGVFSLNVDDPPLWLLGDATVEDLKTNIPACWKKHKSGRSTSLLEQYDENCPYQCTVSGRQNTAPGLSPGNLQRRGKLRERNSGHAQQEQ